MSGLPLFAAKVALSALVIVGAAELAKRHPGAGAILVSLPLSSLLALTLLWVDTGDAARVSAFSWGILWALVPSFVFLAALPLLLRRGLAFWPSLGLSCLLTAGAYAGYARLLARFGVAL
ncbi:MAG: DUF3147 family protein [Elusimicrobia bacterium]|nr:DUF3147 family protein [Elusimicrobiota bacterium]